MVQFFKAISSTSLFGKYVICMFILLSVDYDNLIRGRANMSCWQSTCVSAYYNFASSRTSSFDARDGLRSLNVVLGKNFHPRTLNMCSVHYFTN